MCSVSGWLFLRGNARRAGWVTMCSASGWLFLRGNGAATGWVTMCSASGWRLSIYRIGEQAQEIDFGGFSPPP
ncbi:MAG: hypothetical protein AAFR18_23470, partial [Cyanobacteria bacterium J06627_32]